jgi:putative multiple sugar transport system permease protein
MDAGLGIVFALLIGLLIGVWQGYWIAYVRIPAFIVTLAGMLIFRGLTIFMLKGLTIGPFPESFQAISSGFVPDFLAVPGLDFNITAVAAGLLVVLLYVVANLRSAGSPERRAASKRHPSASSWPSSSLMSAVIMLVACWLAAYKGLPIIFIIICVLVIAYSFFTQRTVPGRYFYAMGGNEKAARLSGIKTEQVKFWAYVNMGVLSAVAGLIVAGGSTPLP